MMATNPRATGMVALSTQDRSLADALADEYASAGAKKTLYNYDLVHECLLEPQSTLGHASAWGVAGVCQHVLLDVVQYATSTGVHTCSAVVTPRGKATLCKWRKAFLAGDDRPIDGERPSILHSEKRVRERIDGFWICTATGRYHWCTPGRCKRDDSGGSASDLLNGERICGISGTVYESHLVPTATDSFVHSLREKARREARLAATSRPPATLPMHDVVHEQQQQVPGTMVDLPALAHPPSGRVEGDREHWWAAHTGKEGRCARPISLLALSEPPFPSQAPPSPAPLLPPHLSPMGGTKGPSPFGDKGPAFEDHEWKRTHWALLTSKGLAGAVAPTETARRHRTWGARVCMDDLYAPSGNVEMVACVFRLATILDHILWSGARMEYETGREGQREGRRQVDRAVYTETCKRADRPAVVREVLNMCAPAGDGYFFQLAGMLDAGMRWRVCVYHAHRVMCLMGVLVAGTGQEGGDAGDKDDVVGHPACMGVGCILPLAPAGGVLRPFNLTHLLVVYAYLCVDGLSVERFPILAREPLLAALLPSQEHLLLPWARPALSISRIGEITNLTNNVVRLLAQRLRPVRERASVVDSATSPFEAVRTAITVGGFADAYSLPTIPFSRQVEMEVGEMAMHFAEMVSAKVRTVRALARPLGEAAPVLDLPANFSSVSVFGRK